MQHYVLAPGMAFVQQMLTCTCLMKCSTTSANSLPDIQHRLCELGFADLHS